MTTTELTAQAVMDALEDHEKGCEKRQQEINKEFDGIKQGIRENRVETRWWIGIGIGVISVLLIIGLAAIGGMIAISQSNQTSPIIINGAGTPTPSVALNNEPPAEQ